MKKALLRVLSVICLLCCITGIGFATQNNAQADTVPTVTLKDGAWVRLSTDDAGIRFVAEIDDYSEDYTYGMYIFPTEYLDDYVSGDVVAHAKSKLAEGKKLAGGDCTPYFNEDEGGYRINGVLVNLHYGNLNREFVAVAYVRNGDNYTYSDVSVSRNIVWVSGASVASGKYAGQTTSLSILNNFIKLGSYQAIGVDETTAKAAEGLPEISVSGSTTVYAGLWENPQPTFTCNDSPITNDFNPYVSAVDEGLVYSQKNVRSFTAGSYSIGYENIDGTFTVTVRDLDENLNSDYFGVYDTVDKVSTVVDYSDSICVADAQDAEVILARDGTAKGIEINTNYDLVGKDISIPGLTLDEQMGCEPLNVYVLNSDTAEIYRTVCIKDYFYSATDYTQLFRYVGSGAFSRSNVNHKMRMTLRNEYSLNSKYPTTGFDIEYLKLAYVAGYDYLEFDVSVDAAFAGYANKGIRVFSSRQTTAMEDNAITAATGAHIYKDFGTDVTGATKFTVKVVLKDFLALDASAKQLRFSIGAPQDSNVDFSNFRIRRKSADEIVADYVSKYGFNSVNSKTTANGGKWDVAANGIMGISYNAAKGAMAVNMVNASAAINGRYYVLYTDISMLTDARAAGFNTISFKVSSDNGAFTADGRGIRVFSKTNSGMDNSSIPGATGVYVYGDYGTAADTTEFTVIIDIDNFLALNENTNYLGIVMNIPANTTAYFSDLSAAKLTPAQRAAAFASAYGFNPANSGAGGKWSATGGVMTREYDSEKDAMKVTMSDAGAAIDGRYYVLYTPIAMLTDAQTAGFNQVSFKVSSTDGAFTSAGRGIRVYSKANSGRDGGAIADGTSGVYVYGDFGLAANTTKFTVTIYIEDFLALNPNAGYIGIVINIPNGTHAYFSDLSVSKVTSEQRAAAEFAADYGFNPANSGAGGKWSATGGVMTREYDSEKDSMKVTMSNAGAAIDGRYYVLYTPIAMLTDAQTAGFNQVSFKVSSTDGAFTSAGRGIRVYSKANSGADGGAIQDGTSGVYVYDDFGLAADTTEFTVTINTRKFMSLNEDAGYIGIVINIPDGTHAYFSDLSASNITPAQLAENAADLTVAYGFSSANTDIWSIASNAAITRVWDATHKAMKVTPKAAYNAPSRYPVIYTPISLLKDAWNMGFDVVSFKVSSDDGAFIAENNGIRVFSKKNSGLDGYNIATYSVAGIYVYADYGMEAGTTEFTVVIDIADFLTKSEAYTPNYLGIAIYTPANKTVYFKDMAFGWLTTFKTIAVASDASDAEIKAANQLKGYLEAATGEEITIQNESVAGTATIYIGKTDAFDALGISGVDETTLNGDGFVIIASDGALYITGAIDKGTLNGVYYFLEEYVGVKFYAFDSTFVPSIDGNIFYSTTKEIPAYKYRGVLTDSTMHVDAGQGRRADKVADFYAKTRQSHEFLQETAQPIANKNYGGSVNLFKGINQSHNNLTYVNPDTYYESNPSMFYVDDGKVKDICYSSGINTDGTIASGTNAASVYVANLKAYITANPNVEYFMLGQEDVRTRCTCSACNSGALTYGYSTDNGYAAVVLRFYNAVAKEIYAWETANSREHVKLVVFSYLFSSKAPVQSSGGGYTCHETVALADNVVIRFADFTANQYYSFVDANQVNGYGSDYLTKWACIIGDNDVWYWGYATNHSYYFAYTPSLQKISAVLSALKDIDAEYVLIQHDSYENNDWRAKMESYVINKMLWDRTLTATTLRDEYIDGYYGVASAKIKTFVDNFDTCMASIAGNASTREYFLNDIMSVLDDPYAVEELVTKDFLLSQLTLLDEAIAAIEASELSDDEKNVLIARVNAVKVTPLFYLAYAADGYYNNSSDRTTVRSTFISLCESLGITCYGEQKYIVNLKTEWGL